jgi:hypothetical protein
MFKTTVEDNPKLNPMVAIPRKDLDKLEEARKNLIDTLTEGLEGVELTRMMCLLEPATR